MSARISFSIMALCLMMGMVFISSPEAVAFQGPPPYVCPPAYAAPAPCGPILKCPPRQPCPPPPVCGPVTCGPSQQVCLPAGCPPVKCGPPPPYTMAAACPPPGCPPPACPPPGCPPPMCGPPPCGTGGAGCFGSVLKTILSIPFEWLSRPIRVHASKECLCCPKPCPPPCYVAPCPPMPTKCKPAKGMGMRAHAAPMPRAAGNQGFTTIR